MSRSNRNDELLRSQKPSWARKLVAAGVVAGVGITGGLAYYGASQIKGNWDDTADLMVFTSPEGQKDRCEVQAAFDAQVKMRKHFEAEGGVSPELAETMGGFVGLESDEVTELLTTKLYTMNYDCNTPEASSSHATKGMLALAFAGALAIGLSLGAAGASIWHRDSRKGRAEQFEAELRGYEE